MPPKVRNLFERRAGRGEEIVSRLVARADVAVEHIESNRAASPPAFWYDQDTTEWVALVRGRAVLEFPDGRLALGPGDTLLIEAHVRHRVAETSDDAVWIAVHLPVRGQSSG